MGKILHVDNEPFVLRNVAKDLERGGHEIVSVTTLEEAKKAYDGGKFDVVICDGDVESKNDGIRWALELAEGGQKVIILSAGYRTIELPGLSFVEKGDYNRKTFLKLIEEI
ncbi:hypothetical protein A2962_04560 [Candidatus Woesebacteria bacterium RIFCSPLOWO2_01_FULL_39_61]|uniref:Response regulatory domain-containing protein n=1 Tax=Candidatus Woesebacteria bacterium RIFCSPHIGHO2_02_FULL_39_13 TaxID=1802505 RepID=A0A1F7YXC6_9BACT|nr:MAG: hypothetical protein A2692_05875 [Candidatus Woesebacteria bacterium RIFCSPHIGHO2_01_FULL_39_95]OGM31941.1 MAG: hypothetical protein A3D01_00730 [Candidatus Woesebacteria bacterium RIFCSPHIGHO2_02_FULL_39_13]OGM36505.1 MAG: hypothetical protein A3E13_02505 [Candidatus Woesebacteria bacterium RIFCSPHIGHO2_12_FULL_40_20]OGM65526.1 MAG: hypothetical protein A2962_04560 [Candidatus Woesebacteria bacterium RIFCSPLOWO2_01_FULL_39_61]OGM73191.1 MAG: hypothetical protein A3H19_02025 [Candidatus